MLIFEEESLNIWVFRHNYPEGIDDSFNICTELIDAGNLVDAEKKLREILFVCPNHIDALQHLALVLEKTDRDFDAYLCVREAVRICLEEIPPKFSWLTDKILWTYGDNRAFMRAYHSLACHLWRMQYSQNALDILARLVSVNPNDNLGARYLLMGYYLDTNSWAEAIRLAQLYPDDTGPDISYSKAVALFQLGRISEARNSLQWAIKHSPNVAIELLKLKHTRPKSIYPGCITVGGADEVFYYWETNSKHWSKDSGVFNLLHDLMGEYNNKFNP